MAAEDATLVPGLQTTRYVYDPMHMLLAADAGRGAHQNIGVAGSNLTIGFLSLNRANLSLRLLESIAAHMPGFQGRVLVLDNHSDADVVAQIKACAAEMPFDMDVVEMATNHGVAGGRNRMVEYVRTEWLMCLDNDIYFTTNPLPRLQRDLSLLGCHFLNLPLLDSDGETLFAKGGHLYPCRAGDRVAIGAGSVYTQRPDAGTDEPAFLSTFLFGGACVMRVDTFKQMGRYDAAMFVGFEDIDFSIRLFRAGQKIGNATVLALVHDHPSPESPDDTNYERERFSREILHRSARHLEQKYGLSVWNEHVDDWLRERHAVLGIDDAREPADERVADPARPAGRPRIALVVDTDQWAFWNIAQQLERYLGDRFEFRIIPTEVVENVVHAFMLAAECDLMHVFWREYLGLLEQAHSRTYVEHLGGSYDAFRRDVLDRAVLSTCIYDHLHLGDDDLRQRLPLYRDRVRAYYVGSERLRRIYAAIPGFPQPVAVLPDGVDPERFYPQNLARLAHVGERELIVGWTGNSNWAAEFEDFKGVRTILRPAIEQLQAEGLPIRLHALDRADGGPLVPHDRMVGYYAQIDVYACTSKIEGTPNPVLESMACGVPIVSTDVGIVREALGAQQGEFVLAERSIDAVKAALRRLIEEPGLLPKLAEENLSRVPAWSWAERTRGFGDYFEHCLALKRGASGGTT
jgi:glycosyltransferase involved in cell wall biosynthesis